MADFLDKVGSLLDKAGTTIDKGVKTEVTVNIPKSVYLNLAGTAVVVVFVALLLQRLFGAK